MRFVTDYPVRSDLDGIWIRPETIISACARLEAAGFHGLGITDHPAPSLKWLHRGGHEAFDPFGMLSFLAAATSRVSLWTHLLVVPYRNPLLQLSGMTTVDVCPSCGDFSLTRRGSRFVCEACGESSGATG